MNLLNGLKERVILDVWASIDNHGSGYLGMAGCSSVQGKK